MPAWASSILARLEAVGTAPLLLAALTLRLGVALLVPMPEEFAPLSEPGVVALNLVSGGGLSFDFYGLRPEAPLVAFLPPLHPWLMALALLTPWPSIALAILQAVLGAATVGLLARLGEAVAGRRVGLLAGWAGALYPAHLLITSQPISVALNAFCLILVLSLSYAGRGRPKLGRGVAVGAAVGLLSLSRPQMVGIIPIWLLWLWLEGCRGKALLRSTGGLVLGTLLLVAPWVLRNSYLLGGPVGISTNGGFNFWNGNNPFTTGSGHDVYPERLAAYQGVEADPTAPEILPHPWPYPLPNELRGKAAELSERELDRALYRAGLDFIREQPAEAGRLFAQKLVSFWWFRPNMGWNPLYRSHWTAMYKVGYAALVAVSAAGLALSVRHWRRYFLIYGLLAYVTLIQVAYHTLTRYRWELELLLVLLATVAVERVWKRFSQPFA